MIRVLNIVETIRSGGVERRRLSLAKHLDKSQFELKIICTHKGGNIADEIEAQGVEVIRIGNLNSPFHWSQHKKVQKIIDEFQPHIIHGAIFEGVTMAAVNGFFKRVPIVILEETSDPQNRSWKGNLLMKLFSLVADKVIGVSPAATAYLTDTLGISPTKVELVTNGVAIPREVSKEEQAELKQELQISDQEIVIGSTGRMMMDSHKRFSDLIKAFAILVHSGLNVKLVLVGEGREKENYMALVKELKIAHQVIFAGYQSDTAKFYSIFDVFSLVSAYEAFGLVLAEAMLHKLPVVATNVGGMRFIVSDNETGFLVEKYQITAIADKLMVLCNDAELRKRMGKKGYERAMENYTEENYVKKIAALYLELCEQKKIIC